MREVKVIFTDGGSFTTRMNPRLTNSEIKKYYQVGSPYYQVGSSVNVGCGELDFKKTIKEVIILK